MKCTSYSEKGKRGAAAKVKAEKKRIVELCQSYNLPLTLKAREVQLCLILIQLGKAVTRKEWLEKSGMDPRIGRSRTDGGKHCYILQLEKLGLITRIKRHRPMTGGRDTDLYLPTIGLLERLASEASGQFLP
jgi:hypothetical protein